MPGPENVRYTVSVDELTSSSLRGFFVDWPNPPDSETHLRILKQSDYRVLALDHTGRVVGFVTAITDGVISAYIPLLEVLPEYQKRGIGTELMKRVLEPLEKLYMVDLICNVELEPFYAPFGFHSFGGKVSGLVIRRFQHQAGRERSTSES